MSPPDPIDVAAVAAVYDGSGGDADACASGLPSESADFVWSEDAWVYVPDKARLVAEAARIVKPGGTIAFSDWVEGPAGLSAEESEPLFAARPGQVRRAQLGSASAGLMVRAVEAVAELHHRLHHVERAQ